MWLMTKYAACSAGPMALSTMGWLAKLLGSASSSASMTLRASRRLTSRSSGAGWKGSSSSVTTSICGWLSPGLSE